MIEFSDFECPYCARSAREVLPDLEREYFSSGRALLAWRHYPLPFHNQAQTIHEASECAAVQGKFWEFHDWVFSQGKIRDQAVLRLGAEALQLDLSSFGTCLDGQARAKVQADVDLGDTLSITGTPTWFIGAVQPDGTVRVTHRLTGAKPFAAFKKAIDEATMMLESSRN